MWLEEGLDGVNIMVENWISGKVWIVKWEMVSFLIDVWDVWNYLLIIF